MVAGGKTQSVAGTSYSAPIVAGLMAQVRRVLRTSFASHRLSPLVTHILTTLTAFAAAHPLQLNNELLQKGEAPLG